jgi:hypothetical protein
MSFKIKQTIATETSIGEAIKRVTSADIPKCIIYRHIDKTTGDIDLTIECVDFNQLIAYTEESNLSLFCDLKIHDEPLLTTFSEEEYSIFIRYDYDNTIRIFKAVSILSEDQKKNLLEYREHNHVGSTISRYREHSLLDAYYNAIGIKLVDSDCVPEEETIKLQSCGTDGVYDIIKDASDICNMINVLGYTKTVKKHLLKYYDIRELFILLSTKFDIKMAMELYTANDTSPVTKSESELVKCVAGALNIEYLNPSKFVNDKDLSKLASEFIEIAKATRIPVVTAEQKPIPIKLGELDGYLSDHRVRMLEENEKYINRVIPQPSSLTFVGYETRLGGNDMIQAKIKNIENLQAALNTELDEFVKIDNKTAIERIITDFGITKDIKKYLKDTFSPIELFRTINTHFPNIDIATLLDMMSINTVDDVKYLFTILDANQLLTAEIAAAILLEAGENIYQYDLRFNHRILIRDLNQFEVTEENFKIYAAMMLIRGGISHQVAGYGYSYYFKSNTLAHTFKEVADRLNIDICSNGIYAIEYMENKIMKYIFIKASTQPITLDEIAIAFKTIIEYADSVVVPRNLFKVISKEIYIPMIIEKLINEYKMTLTYNDLEDIVSGKFLKKLMKIKSTATDIILLSIDDLDRIITKHIDKVNAKSCASKKKSKKH